MPFEMFANTDRSLRADVVVRTNRPDDTVTATCDLVIDFIRRIGACAEAIGAKLAGFAGSFVAGFVKVGEVKVNIGVIGGGD